MPGWNRRCAGERAKRRIWVWIFSGDPRLSKRARQQILEAEERYFSAASVWELAIKATKQQLWATSNCYWANQKNWAFCRFPSLRPMHSGYAIFPGLISWKKRKGASTRDALSNFLPR
jgi:hypothetical protein